MARALYNRETLAAIRGLTVNGKGVHAIAREIEWTAQELRTVAARHSIPVIEDDPEGKRKPIDRVVVAVAAEDAPREKPRKTRGALLKTDCTGVKRNCGVTLLVSQAAMDAGREVAVSKGVKPGAVLAIALDHACRTGRLRALFDEAMAGAQ